MKYMVFSRDPIIGNPEFGVFLFGIIYLLYRGLFGHALILLVLFIPTFGLVWLWYIFNTRKYLTRKYFLDGYFNNQILR